MTTKRMKQCVACEGMMPEEKMQCPCCHVWQTTITVTHKDETILLSEVSDDDQVRICTGPWDTAFGGGMLPGFVYMIGGGPGAGKSTLMLQISDGMAKLCDRETLYIAAEESGPQIRARARRLHLQAAHKIRILPMGARCEIGEVLRKYKPCFTVIDSITGLMSDYDDQCVFAERIKTHATLLQSPFMIVNQISQQSDFAGKTKLQHAVDGLFTFFADDDGIRTLFVEKNRDGQAQIKLAFGMAAEGLYPILCEQETCNLYACTCELRALEGTRARTREAELEDICNVPMYTDSQIRLTHGLRQTLCTYRKFHNGQKHSWEA